MNNNLMPFNSTIKQIMTLLPFMAMVLMMSCTKPAAKSSPSQDSSPITYENDLFSIELPHGWEYDDSNWNGLDSLKNEVDFYDSKDRVVWFHVVKAYFPIQWKNIEEATEFAKTARELSGDSVALVEQVDSVMIDGYPSSVLLFANFVDNDTIMQKQFVTYLQDSHIVIYFNENFFYKDWTEAQQLGDPILGTIKLKKVKNPLEEE